ncbi:hypothetical protein Pelo_17418 [Pelomyxa schiedti]|nr:hypothetical protein Pelo_17418 [Pelomyxa schiedti]
MTEWARSPALVRQWADDWVLPPLWDAVFKLPIKAKTRDPMAPPHFFHVSVSLTLGIVGHSEFVCGSEEVVCGCLGENRVLVTVTKRNPGRDDPITEHMIRDTTAPWSPECCLPEASLAQIGPTRCNWKWIVGCDYHHSMYIHKVVHGSPVGADVTVMCRGSVRGVVPMFTPLGDDIVQFRETHGEDDGDYNSCSVVVFVDLEATFNKKDLVVISKIDCGPNWALPPAGITWMPDSSPCILRSRFLVNPETHAAVLAYTLVDPSKSHATVMEFRHKTVLTLGKNHFFAVSAQNRWSAVTNFEVFHNGDLTHPTLSVPCTWAARDPMGLILSTYLPDCGATEIQFSLHDGVTGFHIAILVHATVHGTLNVSLAPWDHQRVPSRPLRTSTTKMCYLVTCPKCGKKTWAGCGRHAEQVMAPVPVAERCTCPRC